MYPQRSQVTALNHLTQVSHFCLFISQPHEKKSTTENDDFLCSNRERREKKKKLVFGLFVSFCALFVVTVYIRQIVRGRACVNDRDNRKIWRERQKKWFFNDQNWKRTKLLKELLQRNGLMSWLLSSTYVQSTEKVRDKNCVRARTHTTHNVWMQFTHRQPSVQYCALFSAQRSYKDGTNKHKCNDIKYIFYMEARNKYTKTNKPYIQQYEIIIIINMLCLWDVIMYIIVWFLWAHNQALFYGKEHK